MFAGQYFFHAVCWRLFLVWAMNVFYVVLLINAHSVTNSAVNSEEY